MLPLQAYANNYTGNAKINRLVFISEKTADAGLALSALRIAAEELKKVRRLHGQAVLRDDRGLLPDSRKSLLVLQGQNTSRYEDVVQRLNGRLGQHFPMDR